MLLRETLQVMMRMSDPEAESFQLLRFQQRTLSVLLVHIDISMNLFYLAELAGWSVGRLAIARLAS